MKTKRLTLHRDLNALRGDDSGAVSPPAPALSLKEIEKATFERDLLACFEYLKTIVHVNELRRQNPKWRVI